MKSIWVFALCCLMAVAASFSLAVLEGFNGYDETAEPSAIALQAQDH